MFIGVEALGISISLMLFCNGYYNFFTNKFQKLRKDRLSGKKSTFVHIGMF